MTTQQLNAQARPSILTVAAARRILKGPLRFADEDQIRAADLLELLEEASRLGMVVRNGRIEVQCSKCTGTGWVAGGYCLDCYGTGAEKVEVEAMDRSTLLIVIEGLRAPRGRKEQR